MKLALLEKLILACLHKWHFYALLEFLKLSYQSTEMG